jgi:hypothetical protein
MCSHLRCMHAAGPLRSGAACRRTRRAAALPPGLPRARAGLPCTAVLWGAWATGMAAASPALLRRLERAGMGAIAPARGLAALAGLLQGLAPRRPRRATPAQAVGNPFVWARFGRPGQSAPFLLAALLDAPAAAGAPAHPPRDGAEAWGPLEAAGGAAAGGGSFASRREALGRELLALVQDMLGPQVPPRHARLSAITFAGGSPERREGAQLFAELCWRKTVERSTAAPVDVAYKPCACCFQSRVVYRVPGAYARQSSISWEPSPNCLCYCACTRWRAKSTGGTHCVR